MRTGRGSSALVAVALTAVLHASASAQDSPARAGTAVVMAEVVAGDTGEPIAGAGVDLQLAADSSVVASTVTGSGGRFRIGRVPEGLYFLRLYSIGYGSVDTEPFELAQAETRELGVLRLPTEAVAVDPIVVSAERNVVTFEADRSSYNVGVMPGTEGASVTEALATIPELEVDIDGQVTLRGEPVAIYIDGRPAPMTGEALALFLEQFPADYLQKIEVLDNPSARYRAEGSGGIVDLVTKEGVELGMSGSVFANVGTRGDYGGGGRGTLQRGDWTLNGGGFLRLSESSNSGYDLRQNLRADPAFLRQDSWSERSGYFGNVDLEARYDVTDRTRVYAEGRVSRSERESSGVTEFMHMDESEAPILEYERARASSSDGLSFDFSTGLEYQWEPRVHQLEVELELERDSRWEDGRDEVVSDWELEDGALVPAELTLEDEEDFELEASLDVDYRRPWGEGGAIELGYVAEWNVNDNRRLLRLIDDPAAAPEGQSTDRGFDQREVMNSVYGTVQRSVGAFSAQVGLRAEHLRLRFGVPTGESFDRDYLHLFPSANLAYRLDSSRRLRLSYSRRIRRPRASVLNPTDVSTDPLNRRVGNPDIEPQFSDALTLHASWTGSAGGLQLSPFYRTTSNGWERITTVDEQGVSTRTYENVTAERSYGASLTYTVPRRDGWRGNVSVAARRQVRDASNLGARYSGESLLLSSRANITARITGSLSAQTNLAYWPPTDLLQGRRDARYRADLGLRYSFLDDRASLRLSLRDPFELRRSSSRIRDQDYIQIGSSRESTRSARISVSYSLGGGGRFEGGRGGGRRRR